MSLKVWLPLQGNLSDQGLGDIASTNTAYVANANGKIGKCIETATNAGIGLGISTGIANTNSVTLCGWFKFNKTSIGTCVNAQSYTSTFKTAVGSILGYNSYGGLSIAWTSNDVYTDGSFSYMNVYPNVRTATTNKSASVYRIVFDKWTHLALVLDRDTLTLSLYVDGVRYSSVAFVSFTDITTQIMLINHSGVPGGNCRGINIPFFANDVRVYDHALSAKEIKEISKALTLHYKLDDPYMEGTTNLITSADGLSNTCYNGAINKYSYGTSTDMYKEVTTWQGRTGTRVHMGTNGLDAYPYVYFDPFNPTGTDYRTLSFDYYPTIQTSLVPYSYNGSYDWDCRVNGIRSTALNSNSITLNGVRTNTWNHIEITAHRHDEGTARGTGYIRIGSAKHTSNVSNFWFFSNIQVELKDHATPYTLYNTTRAASTTVHDCSGFKYNAIPNNLTLTSPGARYDHGSVFNGTNSYVKCESVDWMVQGEDALTVNVWVKAASWPTDTRFFSTIQSGGFSAGQAGSSGYYRFRTYRYTNAALTSTADLAWNTALKISDLPTDAWCMLTFVYSLTGLSTYINGVLHSTYAATSYGLYHNTDCRLFIGCEAATASPSTPYFNGQMSDFRLYYTALSADDILELYQTSASVDKSGNVYARELVEV